MSAHVAAAAPATLEIVTVRRHGHPLPAGLLAPLQDELTPGSHLLRRSGWVRVSPCGRAATGVRSSAPACDAPAASATTLLDGIGVGPDGRLLLADPATEAVATGRSGGLDALVRASRGTFLLASCHHDGSTTLWADPLGTYPIYLCERRDVLIAGNNALLIEQALRSLGMPPTRTADAATQELLLGSTLPDRTGYAEIRLAPPGYAVSVTATSDDGLRPVVDPATLYQPTEPVADLLDRAATEIGDNVTALAAGPFTSRVCDLTGGADSRVVLAACLQREVADRFAYRCLGEHPGPDVAASEYLQDLLGLTQAPSPPGDATLRDDPLGEVRRFVHRTMGSLLAYVDLGLDRSSGLGAVHVGGGMAAYKGVSSTGFDGTDVASAARHLLAPARRLPPALPEETIHTVAGEVERLLAARASAGYELGAILDQWHLETRMRSHFGLTLRLFNLQQPAFHALYSQAAIQAAMAMPTHRRTGNRVGFELLCRLYEPLVALPFAEKRWDPGVIADHPDAGLLAALRPFTSASPLVAPAPGRVRPPAPVASEGRWARTPPSAWAREQTRRGRPPWWVAFDAVLPVAREYIRSRAEEAHLWDVFNRPTLTSLLDRPLDQRWSSGEIRLVHRVLAATIWLAGDETATVV